MIKTELYKYAAALTIPLAIACSGSRENKGISIQPVDVDSPGISIQFDANSIVNPIISTKPPTIENSNTSAERVTKSFEIESYKNRNRPEDSIDTSKFPQLDICLSWPVESEVAAYFSKSHPLGIDIDTHDLGGITEIRAPANGKVVFSGGNPEVSYGNYIIIDHGLGVKTLYGHLSELDVKKNQEVSRGSIIGMTGKSGYATGYHLHFELWNESSRQNLRYNPLDYLDQNVEDNVCTHR